MKKIETSLYHEALANAQDGLNTLFFGPTGATKTASVMMAFDRMRRDGELDEVVVITMSPGFEDIDMLTKYIASGGAVEEIVGPLRRAFEMAQQGKRVGVLIDEINRAEPSALNILLTALDQVHGSYVLNDFVAGEQYVANLDRIVFMGTANIGNAYAGVSKLDEALIDRFHAVKYVGYDDDLEAALVKGVPGGSGMLAVARALRQAYASGHLSSPFSTRQLINWIRAVKNSGATSKKGIIAAAERTWVYRLVGVDGFGFPVERELELILGALRQMEV